MGLVVEIFFVENDRVYYLVSDNFIENTYDKIISILPKGTKRYLIMDKIIEEQLNSPYNPCEKNLKSKGF